MKDIKNQDYGFKMLRPCVFLLLMFSLKISAVTFNEAVSKLGKHEVVEKNHLKAQATSEEAKLKGSWGDPVFKLAAKNYPEQSLKNDESAMTGVEFGLSQKIALTTKYGNLKEAFESLARAYHYEAKDSEQVLMKILWETLILKRKINEELFILKENKVWISKILKVSKRLYTTGKTSQQALLDIQIRNSELESEVSNKTFEKMQMDDRLKYLIGSTQIDMGTIPWSILVSAPSFTHDNKELSLKEKLLAKDLNLTASNLNFIPDITVSVGVTKRANIDGHGDFIGGAISFPLPLSSEKYSHHKKAVQEKYSALNNIENYKKKKIKNMAVISKEIQKIEKELSILKNSTIKFAQNSRQITSKSYGLGHSSYVELLQSELKLQKILMHKVLLEATRDLNRTNLKYLSGEPLHD